MPSISASRRNDTASPDAFRGLQKPSNPSEQEIVREREADRETHGGGGGFFFFFLLLLLPASDPPPPRRPTACSHAAYSSAALFVRGGPTLPSFAETRLDRLTLPSNSLRLTFAAADADAADVFGDQVPGAISVERVRSLEMNPSGQAYLARLAPRGGLRRGGLVRHN
jgi:hypothetical protein